MFSGISFCGGLRFAPCRLPPPSFPCIFALWAFISLHFGLVGLHFLAFWPCGPLFPFILAFSGSASGAFPTSCQKWPVCPTSLQWIYQRRDRLHFAVSGLLGLHVHAFSPYGPSFPCILALWAFISFHFGLVGVHFLAFWPCGPSLFLFWPFRGRLLGPSPQVAKNGPFAHRPYNGFISAVTGSILQFLAFWPFISLHSGLMGLHFLVFWPCGPSFPCILALWAFISLHFGLVGLHFLAFWPFRGQLLGPPPTRCQESPVCPTSLQWIYQRRDRPHFAVFSLLGLHFLAFWPCGPSFPCILALWAFISLHFGLVGLHFLAFWPCGPSFPCILVRGPPHGSGPKLLPLGLVFLHFGLLGRRFVAFSPFAL